MAQDKKLEEVSGNETKQLSPSETVEISRGDLDLLLQRIDKLEAKNMLKKAKVVASDTVYVTFLDDKPVVAFGQFSKELDSMGNEIIYVDVFVGGHGGTNKKRVEYNDFLRNATRKQATVVSKDVEDIVDEIRDTRTGEAMEVERVEVAGYRTKGLGYRVPVVVESKKTTFHVSLEDGTTLTLNEDVVNL